jgi:hypothetical protein
MEHLEVAQAVSSNLSSGSKLQSAGRYKEAIAEFQHGIERLGDAYTSPEMIDDTKLKLLLAEDRLRADDDKAAAALFSRVLETRIKLFFDQAGR